MNTYTLVHTHKHGTSIFLFRSNRRDVPSGWFGNDTVLEEEPALEELLGFLGVDFEPECHEYLDIGTADNAGEFK